MKYDGSHAASASGLSDLLCGPSTIFSSPEDTIVTVALGTAHLFATVPAAEANRLLDSAWDAGFRRFDTAPSYGYGRSEEAVGSLLRRRRADADGDGDSIAVTTKVGLVAGAPPAAPVRVAKALVRRLPEAAQRRIRGGERAEVRGAFGLEAVRSSIEASLRRLEHVDRLLLHEVRPDDITAELLEQLAGYVERGDVDRVGVATVNEVSAACLAAAPDLFQVAHVAAGLFAVDPGLPPDLPVRVGHGLLGPGARDLAEVRARLHADAGLRSRWLAAYVGAAWSGGGGQPGDTDAAIARVLLARAGSGLTDVIVATSRPAALPHLLRVGSARALGPEWDAVLADVRAAPSPDQAR